LLRVHRDSNRFIDFGICGQPAIAKEARHAVARDRDYGAR